MPDVTSTETPWWQQAFGADYLMVYAHRDDAQAEAEIAALLPHLGQGPVLDACCGAGRHLAALRRRGLPAIGFDWSADLLAAAQGRPELPGQLARADMRLVPFTERSFSAVLMLFTAFGYFDDETNAAVFAAMCRCVASDGCFLLDVPDPQAVRATLRPISEREIDGMRINERRWIEDDRVCKDVEISSAVDGRVLRQYQESVRLYAPEDLDALANVQKLRRRSVPFGPGRMIQCFTVVN